MKATLIVLGAAGYWAIFANAAPNPGAAICGSRGYDTGRDSYWDSTDGTYDGCSALCSEQVACKSFAFKAKECYLYNIAVAGNFEVDSSSPYIFYDASCIKTLPTSTVRPTTSVLTTKGSTTLTLATTPFVRTRDPSSSTTTKSNISTSRPPISSSYSTKAIINTSTSPSMTLKTSTSSSVTKFSTKQSTTFNTSTKTSTSSAPLTQATCAINGNNTCVGGYFTDPCNKGCGCTYVEGCGGYLVPGKFLGDALHGVTYTQCVQACDANQPTCIGITFQKDGSCYMMSEIIGSDQNPSGWYARRTSCSKPCPASI